MAIHLFAKHGFACTDLQDVADDLKVGKGTIYRYFSSKQVLFQAAVDRVMLEMRASIDDATSAVPDPLNKIDVAIRRYLQFFHDHPEYVEMLIQERAVFRDRKKSTYFENREANSGRWHKVYLELIAAGRIRDLPPDQITNVLGDLIYGTMFTNYIAGRTRSLADQADDILEMVFCGLLTPQESERWSQHRRRSGS